MINFISSKLSAIQNQPNNQSKSRSSVSFGHELGETKGLSKLPFGPLGNNAVNGNLGRSFNTFA